MLKEVHEQPVAIRETIGSKFSKENIEIDGINFNKDTLALTKTFYDLTDNVRFSYIINNIDFFVLIC